MGQVKITGAKTEGFKPFTLEITIESPEEAWNLWHRMNMSEDHIKGDAEYPDAYLDRLSYVTLDGSIWDALDNELIKQKLKD